MSTHSAGPISDQVETVAEDLRTHFWRADAQVVANSFGAYLFLKAQSVLPPYPGKVLLLSPIVGAFDHPDKPVGFSPPMPTRLMDMATSGELSCPSQTQIHPKSGSYPDAGNPWTGLGGPMIGAIRSLM
jgi:hypothetical protein